MPRFVPFHPAPEPYVVLLMLTHLKTSNVCPAVIMTTCVSLVMPFSALSTVGTAWQGKESACIYGIYKPCCSDEKPMNVTVMVTLVSNLGTEAHVLTMCI